MATKLTPLHDRIVVRRVEEAETSRGGIIMPASAKDKPQEGEVISLELVYIGTSVVLPVIALVAVALSPLWNGRFDPTAATLDNFKYVLFDYALTRGALRNSLVLAVVGASIGVVLSTCQSYFIERVRSRFRGVADAVVSLPLGIPGIALSLFFLTLALRTPLYGTLSI